MDRPWWSANRHVGWTRIGWTRAAGPLLCGLLLLSSCALSLPWPGGASAPHRGGSVVVSLGDTASLIPSQMQMDFEWAVDQALWAPLWYGGPSGAFTPGLARQVPSQANGDVSADLKTWTIHLKPNLKWSDGSPLTAADLAFSLTLFGDPHFANHLGFPTTDPSDPIGFLGATARDATTVVFTLAHPYVAMTAVLADGAAGPIPEEVFGAMKPADVVKSHENFFPTVTSGPFKMAEHVQGDHITLARNPYYYQGPDKPYLDQITLKVFPTSAAVLHAAQTGRLDAAYEPLGAIDPELLAGYRALAGYSTYLDRSPTGYEEIAFNLSNPILQDKVVRQALSLSLDPKQIRALGPPGILLPTCDDHAGTFAHEPQLTCYPQDPARAAQALDADGWALGVDGVRHKNGKPLELTYSTINVSLFPWRAPTETLAQTSWARIGVKIDIKNYSGREFINSILPNGAFDIAEFAASSGYDPDDRVVFMCDQTPEQGGQNLMRYCNPVVDQQELAQQSTTDPGKRLDAFHTIHAAILDDLPVMYYYTQVFVGIYRSTLHNYQPTQNGTDLWNVWEWYVDQG
jgi:peptide/nickel transport system substrate-binding protein